MKKQILKSALMAMAGVGLLAGSAMALPWDSLDNSYIVSTSMDFFTPTDFTTNTTGNSLFQLEVESASYESNFGIYYINSLGQIAGTFEIFSKTNEPLLKKTLTFRTDGGQFQLTSTYTDDNNSSNDGWVNFNSIFGFYYDVFTDGANDTSKDYTFYTLSSLNTMDAGIEHITTAYSASNKDVYIYLDDQLSSNPADSDWNDMTVFADDVQPVPEPATMLLFGTGLAGLAAVARRRKTQA